MKKPHLFAPRNKGRIYISGTGRAGTTFLVQLLTAMGMDTGFGRVDDASYSPIARAGLEKDARDQNGPQIIKSPFLCDQVDEVVAADIAIQHVIVPVRDFRSAAKSRQHVQLKTTGSIDGPPVVGGLWDTQRAEDQIRVLEHKFAKLIEALTRHDIPTTFVSFPRTIMDEHYLFSKLKIVFPAMKRKIFRRAFLEVAKPELVHDFSLDDGPPGDIKV